MKSVVNDLWGVITLSAVGYSMLSQKILKFDLGDIGELVAVSEMTREYFIKQKILTEHINV